MAVDDLPRETTERAQQLARVEELERLLRVKDAMLWSMLNEGRAKDVASAERGRQLDEARAAMQSLQQGSRDELRARLESGGVLDALADKLHAGARELLAGGAGAPAVPLTAAELTSKFVNEDGAATLSFGGLKSFFGGLEAAVGTPSPHVRAAMQREHCDEKDSTDQLIASNCAPRQTLPRHPRALHLTTSQHSAAMRPATLLRRARPAARLPRRLSDA